MKNKMNSKKKLLNGENRDQSQTKNKNYRVVRKNPLQKSNLLSQVMKFLSLTYLELRAK